MWFQGERWQIASQGGGAGEVRASWGPLILVSRHWADVGVRVHWEPDAGTERAIRCLGWEDFIDGSLWVERQGRGEMPELSCVDRTGCRELYGGVGELLEMRAKHSGKLSGMYPMEMLYLLMECWECGQ